MIETVMKSKMSLRRNLTIAFSLAIALGSVCLTLATRYVFRHVLAEAGLPEGALEHLGGHVAHILAGLAILGALFALFAADVLSKAVTRPVRRLVQAVEQIDCEDLNMAIAAPAGDEFERLGEAFNGMVARLRQSREELETRVQQRTAELSSANAALLFEISHRKESEKRLAYLASFPERDPCPVMEVDWNGHVRYANPAARSLFADIYDRQDAHPWLADWAAVVRMLQEQNAATASRDVVLEGRSYQQLFHHFAQDQFVRIYGLDVTDRKEAERQQAQLLKKLSETNQQLQDFAYVVSHDLKAPLRGIRTIVDWLNADYADQLDEQGREHLSLLVGRAGRMQSLWTWAVCCRRSLTVWTFRIASRSTSRPTCRRWRRT
jgi:HAMP domain-containing protein